MSLNFTVFSHACIDNLIQNVCDNHYPTLTTYDVLRLLFSEEFAITTKWCLKF